LSRIDLMMQVTRSGRLPTFQIRAKQIPAP
jgi:hypothetical protein